MTGDALKEFAATRATRPCIVARLVAAMPAELAAVAAEALAGDEERYPANRWALTVASRGYHCSPQSARLHRRGLCSCRRYSADTP